MTQEPRQADIIRIIDGDTVLLKERGGPLRSRPEERIRMWGIDAPESDQKGGKESAAYLTKIMGRGRTVWVTRMSRDQYGRTVAVLHRDRANPSDSFNREMVRGGHAWCYMLSGPDQARYREAEREAKESRRGLWRRRKIVEPGQYRRRERRKAARMRRVKLALLLAALTAAAAAAATAAVCGYPNPMPPL